MRFNFKYNIKKPEPTVGFDKSRLKLGHLFLAGYTDTIVGGNEIFTLRHLKN